jgi:uncharacterized protein YjbI with pentapeptide repeats
LRLLRARSFGRQSLGANLSGANLSGTNLSGTNLAGANLRGASLRNASLEGANLDGADLRGANLAGATIYAGGLDGANTSGANLNVTVTVLRTVTLEWIGVEGDPDFCYGYARVSVTGFEQGTYTVYGGSPWKSRLATMVQGQRQPATFTRAHIRQM